MQCKATKTIVPKFYRQLSRPLFSTRVSAGFPSPAEDCIEGRIDLNKDLILHWFANFYIRVIGDSMESLICSGDLLIVDRMPVILMSESYDQWLDVKEKNTERLQKFLVPYAAQETSSHGVSKNVNIPLQILPN